MNPNAKLFGMIKINDSEYSLGNSTFGQLLIRATQVAANHKGEASLISIRMSKADLMTFNESPEEILRAQFESNLATAPAAAEVELFPGITVQQAYDAEATPEGQAYKQICNPSKRLGLTQITIEQIKVAYYNRFPSIAPFYPVWQD